ncbi:MAG: polysaccharide biosynthesis/export family protein [Porticoccaceae bacterium]|nr:polysaccharide biosynthesis/export family protein [Porticoccaceae bacterium]
MMKTTGMLKNFFLTVSLLTAGLCSVAAAETYLLNPGDQLDVSVWNEDTMQRTITVLPDGMISFPLVGHLQAAGKSAAQVEAVIGEKLDTFIADPEVNVTVTSTKGNVVFVVGKVLKPGPVAMIQLTTVMQALAMAGGLNEFAAENSIKIIRRSDQSTDTQESILKVRYSDLEKGSDLSSNHLLKAGDVIVVP